MYFGGNLKVTDIVLRISVKTYSRRANIHALQISEEEDAEALNMFEPLAFFPEI